MALDGTMYEGTPLRIKRPKDYIGIDPSLGLIGGSIPDTPNKLFIGGIPTYLNEEQVMELLKSFGDLRSFNLVKEGTAQGGVSKVCVSPLPISARADLSTGICIRRISRPSRHRHGHPRSSQLPTRGSDFGRPACCCRKEHWYPSCHSRIRWLYDFCS